MTVSPNLRFSRSVSDRELALLTKQLGVMLQAGIPLLDTLLEIGRVNHNPALVRTLRGIRRDLEAGSSLSQALAAHPRIFDRLFVNLVSAGEACGELDRTFHKLARLLESRVRVRRMILSACLYPLVILVVAGGVVLAMLFWVIPVFARLFASLDMPLPTPTRFVLDVSRMIRNSISFLCLGVLTAGFIGRQVWCVGLVRRQFDRLLLALPVIGGVNRKVLIARFSATMATLLGGGIPILSGLKMTARTMENSFFERAIEQGIEALEQGESLAGHLAKSTLFPSFVVQLVKAGEKSGQLDRMFTRIAQHCEAEAETAVSALLKLLEPIAILLVGGVVGGIVLSLYLPIFSLAGRLSNPY